MRHIPLLLLLAYFSGLAACTKTVVVAPKLPGAVTPEPLPDLYFASFDAANGDPEQMTFGVGWVDHHQSPVFLKLGEKVKGTHFRLTGFQFKVRRSSKTARDEIMREITLMESEANHEIALPLAAAKEPAPAP